MKFKDVIQSIKKLGMKKLNNTEWCKKYECPLTLIFFQKVLREKEIT